MSPVDGKDDPMPLEVTPTRLRPSHMDPAALAAAEEADRISVEHKWGPARTLLLILAVPAAFWALIALLMAGR